jgi:hypothetical protein
MLYHVMAESSNSWSSNKNAGGRGLQLSAAQQDVLVCRKQLLTISWQERCWFKDVALPLPARHCDTNRHAKLKYLPLPH